MFVQIRRKWYERWKPGWTWQPDLFRDNNLPADLEAFSGEFTKLNHRADKCNYKNCPWHTTT